MYARRGEGLCHRSPPLAMKITHRACQEQASAGMPLSPLDPGQEPPVEHLAAQEEKQVGDNKDGPVGGRPQLDRPEDVDGISIERPRSELHTGDPLEPWPPTDQQHETRHRPTLTGSRRSNSNRKSLERPEPGCEGPQENDLNLKRRGNEEPIVGISVPHGLTR